MKKTKGRGQRNQLKAQISKASHVRGSIPQDFSSFQVHTWTLKFRQISLQVGDLFAKLHQACHTFPKQIVLEIQSTNSLSATALVNIKTEELALLVLGPGVRLQSTSRGSYQAKTQNLGTC